MNVNLDGLRNNALADIQRALSDAIPSMKHINEFMLLKCAPDLLLGGYFPNVKEITESMAAYDAVRNYGWDKGFRWDDPNIQCFVIGDGRTPRTGALFAYRTKWQVFSIDPQLKTVYSPPFPQRLYVVPRKIEDWACMWEGDTAVIIAVHSHAPLAIALEKIKARHTLIVAIPCCCGQTIGREPDKEYIDKGILSPKRTVKIWIK